jgi:hypothetical protein
MASGSGEEVGVAFVRLVPSMRGFGPAAGQAMGDELERPAEQAGEDSSRSFGAKFKLGLAAVGVAAGAVLAHGITEALGREKIEGKLAAQLGTTPQVAQKYGKIAGGLYANAVTDDFETAAEAVKATVSAGLAPPGATNKQIQSIATKVSDLASTFDQDLGGVTNAVSQMLRTGLAKNATEATDILTRGFQTNANKADDLVDTLNEYGTQFRKAGLDGAMAVGLMNQAIQGGARDSDLAADAIKEFSIRAVDGSATTAQGFKMLGLNAKSMGEQFGQGGKSATAALDTTLDRLRAIKDPVKQSQAAVALFGTQAEDLGKALYSMDPSTAVDTLGKVGGAAKDMGDDLRNNASTRIEVFKRRAENAFVQVLGTKVLPALEHGGQYAKAFGQKLKTAGHWVQDNQGKLEIAAGVITTVMLPSLLTLGATAVSTTATVVGGWIAQGAGAVAAAARVAVANVGIIAGWIASAATAVASAAVIVAGWALMGIQSLIRAGQMAAAWLIALGPIGLAIAAVAGIAAFIILKWDTIKAWTIKIFTAVVDWVEGAVQGVLGWVKANWPYIVGFFTGPIGLVAAYIYKHWDQVVSFFTKLPGRVARATVGLFDGIKDAFRSAINWVIGKWNGLSFSIPGVNTHIPGVGHVGGFTLSTPNVPYLAKGGHILGGGLAVVGDAGPELLNLPRGASVEPLPGAAAGSHLAALPAGTAAFQPAAAAPQPIVIQAGGLDRALLQWLQNAVRTQGGGSAQVLLGSGG